MSGAPTQGSEPPLVAAIREGDQQKAAIAINDFILLSRDVSNVYLVTSRDGDVLINTGTALGGPRHRALLDAASQRPIRYVVITQSHSDHFGGAPAFDLNQAHIAVERRFMDNHAYRERLEDFYGPRNFKLWGAVMGRARALDKARLNFSPNVIVNERTAFRVGGRRFELLSAPGGETTDSLVVWLPDERIAFTGNLFGPIFRQVPNLYTIRGDKIRSAREYIRSLDLVRDLKPEMLITGHGDPIIGAKEIAENLSQMRCAVQFIHDKTVAGMNAGHDVHRLMREIKLPPEFALGEAHGKVAWNVRAIWEEYAGWFHYDSTTALYGVPAASVYPDIVALAGGATALANRALGHIDAGRPLEALHLTEIALRGDPQNHEALAVKAAALKHLLEASGGLNLSETMWLRSEISDVEARLTGAT